MNLLDIIIPQYNETEEMVKRCLDSIKIQQGIDLSKVNIYLINDHSENELKLNFKELYPTLNIIYSRNDKNIGPGLTRQKGFNMGDSRYVTYIDSDDYLNDKFSLYIPISCLNETEVDFVSTSFIYELKDKNGEIHKSIKKPNQGTAFLHGKIFRRDFLNDNGIAFTALLRDYEDSYFLSLCNLTGKSQGIDYATYVYTLNEDGITKKKYKHNYYVETIKDYFNCPLYVMQYLRLTNNKSMPYYFINSAFTLFIMLNSNMFNYDDIKELKNEVLSGGWQC